MLSQLDNIIFPDRCDVLEVAAQRYVYPIYKNGSSALTNSGFTVLPASIVKTSIDVFVRTPYERFLSGVQTYLHQNSHLDKKTSLHFIDKYLFLNRHYCPQFHWLVNLQRHTSAPMRLLPVSQIGELTARVDNKQTLDPGLEEYFLSNNKIQFYLQLDKVLTEDLIGQTVTMKQITDTVRVRFPDVYQEVIQRSQDICTVLG